MMGGMRRIKHIDINADLSGPTKVKVGYPSSKVGGEIAQIAVWTHYGTRGGASGGGWGGPVPPRPFLMNAINDNKSRYLKMMQSEFKRLIRGKGSLENILRTLGIAAQGDIQSEITNLSSPPNSPVTIKMKGSSNPLIDTGRMRAATAYELDD